MGRALIWGKLLYWNTVGYQIRYIQHFENELFKNNIACNGTPEAMKKLSVIISEIRNIYDKIK